MIILMIRKGPQPDKDIHPATLRSPLLLLLVRSTAFVYSARKSDRVAGENMDETTQQEEQGNAISRMPAWLVALLGGLGLIYILNPSLGVFELLPDQLPLVGNLDEGAAAMLLYHGVRELRNRRKNRKDPI